MPCKVDRARLQRAFGLRVRRLGADLYEVTGGRGAHLVRYAGRKCDCADHVGRDTQWCKHLLAVLLTRLTPARVVRAALWCGLITAEEA